jgi:membrane-associated phospholipid phosphatase
MNFFEWLISVDKAAMIFIHQNLTAPWLDKPMIFFRSVSAWIPLYAFIAYWSFKKMKPWALLFMVLTVATFAVCDFSSASIFKPIFSRLRPCYETDMQRVIRSLVSCGGLYSFPSSHAANHFGLAAFWFYSVKFLTGKLWRWVWLWAVIIGFAQVYVGKHYPLDIAGGALLGFIIGVVFAKLFERLILIKQQNKKNFSLE